MEYADLIKKYLDSCRHIEPRPHFPSRIEIPPDNPSILYWKDKICLKGNRCLTVYESALFENDKMTERSFAYDFSETKPRKLIWRICNHMQWQPVTSPCHIHLNPDNPDERLEYFSDSIKPDFMYAMHCVKNSYEGKPQEWEDRQQ